MTVTRASTVRTAEATWQGSLATGEGAVSAGSSGTFSELPVSWPSRTEQPGARTSPEELLAAAHATCFSMAFASGLTKAGSPPDRLDVRADVTFEQGEGGWSIARSALTVRARVSGVDDDTFQRLAQDAKENCPVSRALAGNVEMSVSATREA